MKRPIILILYNILVLILFCGCASDISKEERIRSENAEKEAIPVIYEHFKSKYGIDVGIESVTAKFSGCAHDSDRYYTGLVQAVVIYNDNTYSAHVEDQIVYDNYQAKQIEQACLAYACEKLDLPEPVFYKISPHYRDSNYEFGTLKLNEYFDGTNIEKIFNRITPSFTLVYEGGVVIDKDFPEKLSDLFQKTAYDEQSMEYIVLKKSSAEKIDPIPWYDDTAEYYAPYVEYIAKYEKNQDVEPKICRYSVVPFSRDLPILKDFLILRDENDFDDFQIQQEEPPKGWDISHKFQQITPSYHIIRNENDSGLSRIFIPASVWRKFFEKYDDIYLIEYREYVNGQVDYMKLPMDPDKKGYTDIALYGEYFGFDMGTSTDYITFIGIRK